MQLSVKLADASRAQHVIKLNRRLIGLVAWPVTADLVSDHLGTLCKAQSALRLLQARSSQADVSNHYCFGVPSQRVLEQERQAGVPVGNVHSPWDPSWNPTPLCQLLDD